MQNTHARTHARTHTHTLPHAERVADTHSLTLTHARSALVSVKCVVFREKKMGTFSPLRSFLGKRQKNKKITLSFFLSLYLCVRA